jgi:hypothetical protein
MFAPEARGVYRDRNLTGQKRLMTHAPAIDHDFSRAGLYRKIPSTCLIGTVAKTAGSLRLFVMGLCTLVSSAMMRFYSSSSPKEQNFN